MRNHFIASLSKDPLSLKTRLAQTKMGVLCVF